MHRKWKPFKYDDETKQIGDGQRKITLVYPCILSATEVALCESSGASKQQVTVAARGPWRGLG